MNRDRLLAAAKAKALAWRRLSAARATSSARRVLGKAALMLAVDNFVRLQATAYDRIVAEGLADVLTGGPEADPVEPLPRTRSASSSARPSCGSCASPRRSPAWSTRWPPASRCGIRER
jgi:hypothetical protein